MSRTKPMDNDHSLQALVPEHAIVGLYRHESDLPRLVASLRYVGIDIRKLSIVMLQPRGRKSTPSRDDENRSLRTGLILDGAVRHDIDAGSLLVAGPIKTVLVEGSEDEWLLQGLLRALDETLSAWGMDVQSLGRFEAGIAAGRCLALLHVVPSEKARALEAMRRAAAEYVSVVNQEPGVLS